jgi:hypothetical protein
VTQHPPVHGPFKTQYIVDESQTELPRYLSTFVSDYRGNNPCKQMSIIHGQTFFLGFFFLSEVGQSSTGSTFGSASSTFGSASSTYDDVIIGYGNTGYTLSR